MTNIPSAMTWGLPTATKHALLIHGLTSSPLVWHRVATSLVSQGYLVTAPYLVGHGSRVSTDYRINAIAEDLLPYLEAKTYSLIIGHSLGALTTLALTALLSPSQQIALVLIDPPMQISQESIPLFDGMLSETCANPVQANTYSVENPLWGREDCIYRELGTRLCPADTVHGVHEQNKPWYFFDYLDHVNTTIATSKKWRMTVLVAYPTIYAICPVEDLRRYPHVRPVIVSGAGHWIQCDFPDVVVEESLKTVAELEVVA